MDTTPSTSGQQQQPQPPEAKGAAASPVLVASASVIAGELIETQQQEQQIRRRCRRLRGGDAGGGPSTSGGGGTSSRMSLSNSETLDDEMEVGNSDGEAANTDDEGSADKPGELFSGVWVQILIQSFKQIEQLVNSTVLIILKVRTEI